MAMEVEVEEKKDDLGDIVISPLGLFPRPWVESSCDGKVIEHFWLFGCVMAKALQDGRLLDMPLSTAFYKLVLGQELDLHDVSSFDAELGKTLQELQAIVCRKKYLESTPRHDCNAILDLNFRGAPVEDLCLDFTLPGFPDYILRPGNEDVSIDNLEEYISLVVAATVKTGITDKWKHSELVFDITALQIFTPNELDHLLCGQRELWEADKLVDHIKFDHGYTSKSPAIVNLLEIMESSLPNSKGHFLTIVRKHSSTSSNVTSSAGGASESADDDLPSVMTCANYLKLPAYSTKEIMYKQLVYAITFGIWNHFLTAIKVSPGALPDSQSQVICGCGDLIRWFVWFLQNLFCK
ncbi:unnamed protein product [Lactuca saligna]|uniref:HECT domain-containing protein n=1 Tax=Lactuca saligna TaxID=75948 RepID=A0AA35ZV24_LACSI|nr:unnamed protein product [Lactuca saligna]